MLIISHTDEGYFAEYCSRLSPLYSAGLKQGDLIIGVNGICTESAVRKYLLELNWHNRANDVHILRNRDTLLS